MMVVERLAAITRPDAERGTVKTVFDACVPREEVLQGELKDEMFAARLRDVIEGTANLACSESKRFFENTYPTEGLKTRLREVLDRLSGKAPANSPFIRWKRLSAAARPIISLPCTTSPRATDKGCRGWWLTRPASRSCSTPSPAPGSKTTSSATKPPPSTHSASPSSTT